jgi:hypothetical protein
MFGMIFSGSAKVKQTYVVLETSAWREKHPNQLKEHVQKGKA